MGIDIYMQWNKQSKSEKESQFTGFVPAGNKGYLREAYHGEPYATKILVPEAFKAEGEPVPIPAKKLRSRLRAVVRAAIKREREVYKNSRASERSQAVRQFMQFVELAEKMEKKTKRPVLVVASD